MIPPPRKAMSRPLLDTLFNINCSLSSTPAILEKTRINSAIRFGLRRLANGLLPAIYGRRTGPSLTGMVPVVVSMTSFPARIRKVWIVVETMLRQRQSPEKIVLWLSRDQFPGGPGQLPERLLAQQSRGLDIRFVDGDIRSHKKYYYAFAEFPDRHILTIDDDLLFPSTFVGDVWACARRHPDSVIANFGSPFAWDEQLGYITRIPGTISPGETGPHLFFGSGGGTLFPAGRMQPWMDDIDTIWSLCPTADDIYLNAIARVAGLSVTFRRVCPLLSLTNRQDVKLTDHNGHLYSPSSANARQLRALVTHLASRSLPNPFNLPSPR